MFKIYQCGANYNKLAKKIGVKRMCKNNKKYLMLDCMLKFYEIFFIL